MAPKKAQKNQSEPRRSIRLNQNPLIDSSEVVNERKSAKSIAVIQKKQTGRRGRPPKKRIGSDEETEKESDDDGSGDEGDYGRSELGKWKRMKMAYDKQMAEMEPILPGHPQYEHLQALIRRKHDLLTNTVSTAPFPSELAELANSKPVSTKSAQRVEKPEKIDAVSCPICFKLFSDSDTAQVQFENHLRVFHQKFWMEQTGNRLSPPPLKKSNKPEEKETKTECDYLPNSDLGPCVRCRSLGIRCGTSGDFQKRDNRNWFEN